MHLALPRDLVLPVFVGWLWVAAWASSPPPEDPYQEAGRRFFGGWLGTEPKRELQGLERFRNGWTMLGATFVAVGLCWWFVFLSPYWWLS